MEQATFSTCDSDEVIKITLGGFGRLLAIELTTSWRNHHEAKDLAAVINATLAQARLHQLTSEELPSQAPVADDGRLNDVVANWQRYTTADAEAAEAEMWEALHELEKTLGTPVAEREPVRLTNRARNISMAWDGLMLADLAFSNDQIAERPAGSLNESFAEIIAQTSVEEDPDGTE